MMKKHYAWAVLAACCSITLGVGMTINCIGQYFVPVTTELNLGMGQFTLYYAVRGVFLAVSTTLLNKWLEKVEVRRLLSGCFIIQILCTALMGSFTKVWQWYIAGAVMGFFLPPVYMIMPPIILSNWFVKKRGLVIGIAMAFSGIGGAVMNPLIAHIIQDFGWRFAYVANAVIAGVVILPFLMFVVRLHPADKGLKPYGSEEQSEPNEPKAPDLNSVDVSRRGVLREDALRSPSFVFMVILFIVCGFFSGYPHLLAAYGISTGLAASAASYLSSLCMAGNVSSKLLLGFISDKFGGKAMIYTAVFASMVSMLLLLAGANSLPLLLAGAFFAGIFLSIGSTAPPLLALAVYGSRDYSRILVMLSPGLNLFISFAPSIIGYILDASASFSLPLNVGVILAVAAAFLVYLSFATSKKLSWR